jgi:hypothetical protein
MAKFLLSELHTLDEWLPPARAQQYSKTTGEMIVRVELAQQAIEQFEKYGEDISGRMTAWQAGVRYF